MPRIMPEPKYFSMPSSVVGCVVVIWAALNCSPCSRSVVHMPVRADELAGVNRSRVADHGHKVALPARLDPQHAKAVLGVVVGHALHQAGQRLDRCLRPTRNHLIQRGTPKRSVEESRGCDVSHNITAGCCVPWRGTLRMVEELSQWLSKPLCIKTMPWTDQPATYCWVC